MLSATMISQTVRSVVAALSPEKNPCRVRTQPTATSSYQMEGAASSWYRYDPYMSKVLASPLKTQLQSPTHQASPITIATPASAHHDEGYSRNSLFNAPVRKIVSTVSPVDPVPNMAQRIAACHIPSPTSQQQQLSSKRPQSSTPSTKTHYAIVHFKHDSATFVAPFRVSPGDHVIVEGDRGVDLGIISEITTETPTYPVPLKVVRRATSKDMEAYQQKQRKEQVCARQVQTISEELNLNIAVVDCEFQFDNNKLTVFFNAARGQIDFRKLQRGLFREHRCRIWLSNMSEVEYNAQLQKTRRTR